MICHHHGGIGVKLVDGTQYGHVDVPEISGGAIRGPQDYPPIGDTVSAVVLRYSGVRQLDSTRHSAIARAKPAGGNQEP